MIGAHFWLFGLRFDTYSFFIYLAFLFSGAFSYIYFQRIGVGFLQFTILFLVIAIFAPLGASMLSALEFKVPLGTIFGGDSGSTHLGGYLLALPIVLLTARLFKINVLRLMDSITFSWMIGYAVGRFACFFSGDGCYGIPTSSFLGMTFPHGMVPTTTPVWPTPLFESGYSLIIFFAFYYLYARKSSEPTPSGRVFFGASSWMFVCRFAVEYIRRNPKYGGFSLTQWLCMPLVLSYTSANVWLDKWPSIISNSFLSKLGHSKFPLPSRTPETQGELMEEC